MQELFINTDVVIVGGGSAGCCAALAAARQGTSKVLLIERYGFLGGISTQSLDTFYGFFTPGDQPKKVAGGIPDIVVDRLHARGEMFLRANTYGAGTGVTYNPEYLKVLWDQLLEEAGIQVLLHSELIGAEQQEGKPHFELYARHRGGPIRINAQRAVDCSGDAVLSYLLQTPLEDAGESGNAQTFTTTFRMCNVDLDRFSQQGGKRMLHEKMAHAIDRETYPLPRKKGSVHPMVQPNCIATVAVRVPFASPFSVRALSQAEKEGRKQAYVYEDFLRAEVPGFENAKIIGMSSPQIGIRESRRLFGEYRLTLEDCLQKARFEDGVMVCGAPIEDHRQNESGEAETEWVYIPDGGVYQVPYRCFYTNKVENLLVAGRCFSATHSAQASCRSMAQTMSMGQAVGTAAALSLEAGCIPAELSIVTLTKALERIGAILEEPEKTASTERDAWMQNRK